ncbi:MAG TPA: RidA family protein [Candidatus Manganitrophaceae bacterium]|nr:RidA family protein [Candidatus Manganitrophaceae bacterium]
MDYEKKLLDKGLALPFPPKPVATYVSAVRTGNLLFLSGMLPFVDGKLAFEGKVGKELTVEQGQKAAQIALLNALAVIKAEAGGLEQVRRIVRISVHVASAPGFTQQPAVANGASDLLVHLFGEAGRHARLALGAAELPLNAPVELEMIVEVAG